MRVVGVATVLMLLMGFGLSFLYAPRDAVQGNVQRIMYIHVPSVLTAYLAFGIVFVGSLLYLWRRRVIWDELASASAEAGVVFTGITLLTGSIWGKPTWGTWWTWDARLTSTAILFVIYVGYLLLRAFVEDPEQGAKYSAIVGIVGALDIPLIHFSVEWWRTLHQSATILRPQSAPIATSMLITLLVNVAAFALLYAHLVAKRLTLKRMERVPTVEV
jgi:heme exporter protein C